jgi:hypothetical protein
VRVAARFWWEVVDVVDREVVEGLVVEGAAARAASSRVNTAAASADDTRRSPAWNWGPPHTSDPSSPSTK